MELSVKLAPFTIIVTMKHEMQNYKRTQPTRKQDIPWIQQEPVTIEDHSEYDRKLTRSFQLRIRIIIIKHVLISKFKALWRIK